MNGCRGMTKDYVLRSFERLYWTRYRSAIASRGLSMTYKMKKKTFEKASFSFFKIFLLISNVSYKKEFVMRCAVSSDEERRTLYCI